MSRPTRTRTLAALALCLLALRRAARPRPRGRHDPAARGPSPGRAAAAGPPRSGSTPASPAARQVKRWAGRGRDARRQDAAADRGAPGRAAGPPADRPEPKIRGRARAAAGRGARPYSSRYNIPHRDCGQHSAGGACGRRGLPGLDRPVRGRHRRQPGPWCPGAGRGRRTSWTAAPPREYQRRARPAALRGDRRLKRQPHTKVYLDAGNPAWIPTRPSSSSRSGGPASPAPTASRSTSSNFQTDEADEAVRRRLSRTARRAASTSSSTPAATATARWPATPPRPGATRRAGRSAPRRPRTPATRSRRVSVDQAARGVGRAVPRGPGGRHMVGGLRPRPGAPLQGMNGRIAHGGRRSPARAAAGEQASERSIPGTRTGS